MKSYPSILNSTGKSFREFDAYVFDKVDGSNLRFEWSRKRGWYKFGTRNRLFDTSDEVFGSAIQLFKEQLEPDLNPIFSKLLRKGVENAIAYAEFFGPSSFAGQHKQDEEKKLYLFDVALYKKGIMGPKQFLDEFGHCQIARFLGHYKWSRDFIQNVRDGLVGGITFEGVVGKSGEGHKLIMAKAKTRAWIDKVRALYTQEEAEKIINS